MVYPSSLGYYNNNQSITQTPTSTLKDAGRFTSSLKSVRPLDDKIESITSGLQQHFVNLLSKQSDQNAETIADYILAMIIEVNPSIQYRSTQIITLCYFSNFHKQKPFLKMTRDDVVQYLDSHRRLEESDPLHKWIGTYNLRRIYLLRFFKWLYNPELEPSKRPVPDVVKNIPSFKRKEQSIYKPTDLWIEQDDTLFLKYCPSKRDRCYHMLAHDSSCRPSEILGLKIKSSIQDNWSTSICGDFG
jgi:integrase